MNSLMLKLANIVRLFIFVGLLLTMKGIPTESAQHSFSQHTHIHHQLLKHAIHQDACLVEDEDSQQDSLHQFVTFPRVLVYAFKEKLQVASPFMVSNLREQSIHHQPFFLLFHCWKIIFPHAR